MFTGIVQDFGKVTDVENGADGVRIKITTPLAQDLKPGDSIAVNGCCLTAVGETTTTGEEFTFLAEVMQESIRRTSLSQAAHVGARVNLELAMSPSDRFGGHIVQGHVDGTATLLSRKDDGFSQILRFELAQPELLRYVVEKGSITIDGVSLTVSNIDETSVEVSLIPETLERTTLGPLGQGDIVNIEVDVLAKHVEKLLAKAS